MRRRLAKSSNFQSWPQTILHSCQLLCTLKEYELSSTLLLVWPKPNTTAHYILVCNSHTSQVSRFCHETHGIQCNLTVTRSVLLRKSHSKQIHKLIHKLFWNFWIFETQQPSPLFLQGLDTTIHIILEDKCQLMLSQSYHYFSQNGRLG